MNFKDEAKRILQDIWVLVNVSNVSPDEGILEKHLQRIVGEALREEAEAEIGKPIIQFPRLIEKAKEAWPKRADLNPRTMREDAMITIVCGLIDAASFAMQGHVHDTLQQHRAFLHPGSDLQPGKLPPRNRILFTAAEIESQLVDLGETLPEDYQDPEVCGELWNVVTKFTEWLNAEVEERTK